MTGEGWFDRTYELARVHLHGVVTGGECGANPMWTSNDGWVRCDGEYFLEGGWWIACTGRLFLAVEWKPADLWVGLFTAPKRGQRHYWLVLFPTLVLHWWTEKPIKAFRRREEP